LSEEDGKALVRKVVEELVNKGNMDVANKYIDSNIFDPDLTLGIENFKAFIQDFRRTFSELQYTIMDMVAESDRVAIRVAAKGTHTGTFLGIPATGKKIKFWALGMFRIHDSKITEHWGLIDILGILKQLRERSL
jgi:steroid delta-isomerase-like uncharacterized protein